MRQGSGYHTRQWERYARALDLRLEGWKLEAIGKDLGVSRERARQMVKQAAWRLRWRVFKGFRFRAPEKRTTIVDPADGYSDYRDYLRSLGNDRG